MIWSSGARKPGRSPSTVGAHPALRVRAGAWLVMLFALAAAGVPRAQSGPPPTAVGGSYEGWIRGSSQGDASSTVVLTQDGAAFSGVMTAGPYTFEISNGAVDGETLSWSFSTSGIDGTVRAVYKAGTITGTWAAAGTESGSIELKRAAER
jgi:hypothetical protein